MLIQEERLMSRPDVRSCAGNCGRRTRPASIKLDEAPGSVIRYRENMCANCWELCQAMRPMTRKEAAVEQSLQAWNRRRDERIARQTRRELRQMQEYQHDQWMKHKDIPLVESKRVDLLEQFENESVFKTLRVTSAYKRLKESKEPGMNEHVEKHGDGTVRYMKDSRGEWRYSILGENGEVMAQSEGYVSLRNAKRGVKRLAERLNEGESGDDKG